MRRPGRIPDYNLQPFWSWHQWQRQHEQIIANILMFIPVGFLLRKPRLIFIGFLFSAAVETIQLLTCTGLFEFDDMIHNTLGTLLGILLYMTIKSFQSKSTSDKDEIYENPGL